MTTVNIFRIHLAFGYLAWALCFLSYIWPRLSSMGAIEAHKAIATLHSFRFFGLVFILPGVVGTGLPAEFAQSAAYGDFAASIFAIFSLLTVRVKWLFWPSVVLFNVIGFADLFLDTIHAIQYRVPDIAGQFGAAYAIPILYVPLLVITHLAAFSLLIGSARRRAALAAAR